MKLKNIIILGPTYTGKTALAVKLCKIFDGEIISADSHQVYKYLDIGSGKMPIEYDKTHFVKNDNCWICDGIKIHMYDECLPDEQFYVTKFSELAKVYISKIKNSGKIPFIVGGTGLYISSLFGGNQYQLIPKDKNLREKLNNLNLVDLFAMLPKDVQNRLNNSDKNNITRLIRKIEIAEYLKHNNLVETPSLLNKKDALIVGLMADREVLYSRSDSWVDDVWNNLIVEVEHLINLGYKDVLPLKQLIYKDAVLYIDKKCNEKESKDRIKFDMHSYIRRQLTWFKKMDGINWFNISEKDFDQKVKKLVELFI